MPTSVDISPRGFSPCCRRGEISCGLVAEFLRISQRTLSFSLHARAGIVIAVVGIELMPEAMEMGSAWVRLLAILGGGIFAVLADKASERF